MVSPSPVLLAATESSGTAALTEHQVLVFLVQVALLVGLARALGTLMKRLGQPAVVGELLAGVLLGPSLLGVVWPAGHDWVFTAEPLVNSATFALAWLGVVFLLVVMGYETDLGIIARFRNVALAVATGSLVIPMLATGALGYVVADRFSGVADPEPWVFAAFFALALSVSALPVVGKILSDLGVMRRNFGQITLAAAMAKDAVGWLILAVLSGVAVGAIALDQIAVSFGGLLLFGLFMFTAGHRLIDSTFRFVMARGSDVTAGVSIAVVAALVGGAVTQALHVEAILGAYLVGLTLARIRHQLPQVRDRLEMMTGAFFAPVFFAVSGIRVDVTALADLETALWTAAAIVLAVVAKVVGTVISGRWAGVETREAIALGAGLSPLGVMGVVVAIIGLNVGVIDETAYTILLLAAVTTSLTAPVMLKWAIARWEPPTEEADRLERESLRDDSELLGASRILLPTRGGSNSVFAARLIAAVFPEAEVTVLTVDIVERKGLGRLLRRQSRDATDPSDVIAALGETPSRQVRRVSSDPAEAIVQESRLGYDLLVVGASREEERASMMATVVERVLRVAGIKTLVVQFPNADAVPDELPRKVLVPITATRSSRAAEEFGYSLARVARGEAVALHVINRPDGEGIFLAGDGVERAMQAAEDMLHEARDFAARLDVRLESATLVAPNAEQEILDYADAGAVDLVVLGTANRPVTDRPFFGHRISYIAEHARVPLVIVALPSVRGTA
jgi:Kef-type K+ transport system membrane component KefB/nucleotide-binding universal stress UspA family protein